ncbi:hypothetical protein J4Q44_G00284850 [Coregonus suidteri]|uniref:Uncharacterized protein n=1 Tax=Coregonus suidteri TaxID=861788 RepID=A0AAN8KZB6_9TELE
MKYYQYPVSQSMGIKAYGPKESSSSSCARSSPQIKPVRSVHFPNDIVFQDYVRQGELDMIGLFIRKKRVSLETIYHSGMAAIHEACPLWEPGVCEAAACSDGFPDIAKYLLSIGADPQAENECGETPADLIDPECTGVRELQVLLGVEDD